MSSGQIYEGIYTGVLHGASLDSQDAHTPTHTHTLKKRRTHTQTVCLILSQSCLALPRGPVLSQRCQLWVLGALNEGIKRSHPLL